ncbi:acyltransferase [Streptacidiphilus sp. P02-A3a]|uniref:acyltransferase family protein n=1 Tax=Streptacidiphilus sp. P02-A3a TaxID=2704468 RepID=UPI0015FDF5F4|nr:acyltransferase [Streptacidiphilus sp. P02-A3a]QMU68420.1 acyltransferase [Streptacidiphilus sp. P02-A3a]
MDAAAAVTRRAALPGLTGLRFWAALLVVFYHLSREYHPLPLLSPLVWYGRDGVTFFFVLSGFVLAWSGGDRVPARVLYWRRFARIWPLHLLATGLALAVTALLGAALPVTAALWSLPLLQAWSPAEVYGGNPAAWSLSAEAWFYLLTPALLRFLRRRGGRTLALLAAGACVVGVGCWLGGAPVGSPTEREWLLDYLPLARTPQFLLGAVTAVAVRRGWRPPVGPGAAVGAALLWHAALIPWSAAVPDGRWDSPYSGSQALVAPLFAVLVAAVAVRDLAPGGGSGLLGGAVARRLGHWSFAWYLVHQSCLRLALLLGGPPRGVRAAAVGWLLVTATSLGLAAALYQWVERPLERWLRALGPQPPQRHGVPGPVVPRARHAGSVVPAEPGQLLWSRSTAE